MRYSARPVALLAVLLSLPLLAQPPRWAPKPVEAKVPWYDVRPDLSNVSNARQLPPLSAEQRRKLIANRFFARQTPEEQLFYLYEENNYRNIPTFVTTDSVLHTYHVFYDFMLRYLEQHKLYQPLTALTTGLLDASLKALQTPDLEPAVRAALEQNAVLFAVPATLLEAKPQVPEALRARVKTELDRVAAHDQRYVSLTGTTVDYTQFIPRGHYTRSPELQRYFRAMLWLGLLPMDLSRDEATLQALLISDALAQDEGLRALWQTLYDPTVFYVGKADDLSYYDYAPLAQRVFGATGGPNRFAAAGKLAQFKALAEQELPAPRIANEMLVDGQEVTQGRQFRVMGQRYIPDSRVLQELTYPKVGTQEAPRHFPLGLDVMAALGSPRAAQLLDRVYDQQQFANYGAQRAKLQAEIAALTPADWTQNLYYGWLWTLQPLVQPRSEGYPAYMRGIAWQDKSLVTALGSWTQLRHDTVLYGKQSVAEAGGDEPPPPPAYVSPEVEVYERLAHLLWLNLQGLRERELIGDEDDEAGWAYEQFIDLADTLARISRKELRNQQLSEEELYRLKWYGSELEGMMLQVAGLGGGDRPQRWWNIENKTDRHMALVTDVHTSFDQVLQEAIGPAAEVWAIVPFKNRLIAARGAMFTYHEFTGPAAGRLTDEAWQAQLAAGQAAPMPAWTSSFMAGPPLTKRIPQEHLGGYE